MAPTTAASTATATAAPRAKKRKCSPKSEESVTDLGNPARDDQKIAAPKLPPKMSFRCPVTIDTVFEAPLTSHVEAFYDSRNSDSARVPYGDLSKADQVAWAESFHDNKTLMGLIVYSQLFPALLKSRIKLNAPTYHWSQLDPASAKGSTKLAQRRGALARIRRAEFLRSVFRGLPYRIDTSVDALTYMKMTMDSEDERFRFFTGREFSFICSERGDVNGSSVFSSCSMALSLLWFATVVLGRPCSLESVILPLSTTERQGLEKRFGCPSQFFDGPIRGLQTNWGAVFPAIGTVHRNIDYAMLEKASEQKYVDGLYVADAYAVFRATVSVSSARGDSQGSRKDIAALVESYKLHSKHGTDSGAVVGVMDVIRSKGVDGVGKMDGSVLGTIIATYGEQACLRVREGCSNTLRGGATLFDDSVSGKLGEVMAHFDRELAKGRKKAKVERTVRANMDPAGFNKKIEAGKMLDPCDPKSIELMHGMLKGLSGRVWRPLRSLIGEALGATMEHQPSTFLRMSRDEGETLYKHLVPSRVVYADVANLCTLLVLSLSFQRSQVLRDSTVDEFVLVPDGTHYKFSFKNRRFKTASSGGSSSAPPVPHFLLTPDQSMIVKFISSAGHRFWNVRDVHDETRRLFVNSKGQNWTQKDIGSRFKRIGVEWLGIGNFSPHTCRSFWSTHALNSGKVGGANIEDFSSFLQVSSATLRNSYMASAGNSAAHTLGSEVSGSVVNAACTGATTEQGARPSTKQLGKRRLEFIGQIRASLAKYGGNGRLMFRDLLRKRKAAELAEGEKWFRWECTYFGDGEERLLKRFLDNNA